VAARCGVVGAGIVGSCVLLGGRAADVLGRRRMFLAGLTVFTAASLASGLAPAPGAMIAARFGQGAGAAMLTPAALSTAFGPAGSTPATHCGY
jgi:MFS family permease